MHTLAANITSILKRQPLSCDMWATLVIRNGLSSRDDPIGQVGEKAAQVGYCGHCRGKYMVAGRTIYIPGKPAHKRCTFYKPRYSLLFNVILLAASLLLTGRRAPCTFRGPRYTVKKVQCMHGVPRI